jgi:hypothetical protein
MAIMKKYSKEEQKSLAVFAADCAEKVLPFFEEEYPQDERPRKAIEACRAWVSTGVFKMADIRGASLAAHAAAKGADENSTACVAAHAAGQAVATAHVTQHAFGALFYALKAILAADPAANEARLIEERNRLAQRLPENIRREVMDRITVERKNKKIVVKLRKGEGF